MKRFAYAGLIAYALVSVYPFLWMNYHNGGDAENHAHHGEQRAQLVRAQVFEAEHQLGQEVG